MPFLIPGKQTQIIPSEHAFPEFPDLCFGTTSEGISVFDAQDYLQKHKPSSTVEDFFKQYEVPIRTLMTSYEIKEENVCLLSKESHLLIDGSLIYLFIAFVEPDFLAYMCERMQEMFSNGFCISDTYLLGKAHQRLSAEALQAMINGQIH